MLKRKIFKLVVLLVLCNSLVPVNQVFAAENDWITLPDMKDIPLEKKFTVTFNQNVTLGNIDGIIILQGGKSLPVDIKVKDKQAFVAPVNKLEPDTTYEMRIFIGSKRYKMNAKTVGGEPLAGLVYKGKTDIKSNFANNELIKGVNHYSADFGEGHPINIYVTDNFEKQYGKGFSYDETISIVNSIESIRKTKPYTTKFGTLNIFMYTNESNTTLPTDYQAVVGSWTTNVGDGVATEMLINGSTMPYDFRTSYVHEFIHYFDYQSFVNEYPNTRTFENYWGSNYHFWLLEGGAEYGSYFFYDYPKNTHNNLYKSFVQPTRESILAYAKAQGGGKKNLIYDVELDSFDDIYHASSNNYGITLSFFWYLVEQFGHDYVYEYVRYIAETFEGQATITEQEKDSIAIKFFKKTEEQVLIDWLKYFNYFDGSLQEYKETTIGTANYILQEKNPLIPNFILGNFGKQNDGTYHFAVNISDWIADMGDGQAYTFKDKSTYSFQLVADGYDSVQVQRDYGFYTGMLKNGEQLYAFDFFINSTEQSKLIKGVTYKLQPIGNDSKYKWVFPNNLTFSW